MTNQTITQSQKRFQESIGSLFSRDPQTAKICLFLKSSSDVGVIRNGGRNGARFAPSSFLSTFKKFAQNKTLSELSFIDFEVSSPEEETEDFHKAQENEAKRISEIVNNFPTSSVCHLGGGHDHIYPLLKALSPNYKKVIVINVDAHADTRTDSNFHSGTPFRQFSDSFAGDFDIYQIGLHPFANSFSTLSPLEKGQSHILWRKDLNTQSLNAFFENISTKVNKETLVVFSLDADALIGSEVPGVSAVNPGGITRAELLELWDHYQALNKNHSSVLGIYELNPLYDTLSSFSMRTIASFVFETF